jgi:hypothetical protein
LGCSAPQPSHQRGATICDFVRQKIAALPTSVAETHPAATKAMPGALPFVAGPG